MFENEFKGKVVLVTGGSRGIGFAAVKGFLAGGAKVYFLSHYEETGAKALARPQGDQPRLRGHDQGDRSVRLQGRAGAV